MSFTKRAGDISGTQTPSSVHPFFLPANQPTITRDGAMGNVTFYWDGLRGSMKRKQKSKKSTNVRTDKKALRKLSCIMHSHMKIIQYY